MRVGHVVYEGQLRTKCTFAGADTVIFTDGPKSSGGLGENFSSTDLVAVGLGTCVMTNIARAAETHNIDYGKMELEIEKEMSTDAPTRIASVSLRFTFEKSCPIKDQERLQRAAKACYVKNSLRQDMEQNIELIFPS